VDCLAGIVDIGMVSRKIYPEEIEKGALAISVTRDAVVPTVNVKNPVFETLLQTGVKRESLIGIYIEGKIKNWGQVTGTSANFPIHVYTRSDACGAAEVWAEYLGGVQEDLLDVAVYGDPGLTVAVKNDVLGIGYNNINYAYDATTKAPFEGISILPIDLNGNGILDEDENFYQDRDAITQAIRMGKYPSPPARDLYFVCKGRPDEPLVREFIKWVLTEGQRYIDEAGYIQLSGEKLKEGLKKLK
jgi:phosphate transport system substrate-binding protein